MGISLKVTTKAANEYPLKKRKEYIVFRGSRKKHEIKGIERATPIAGSIPNILID